MRRFSEECDAKKPKTLRGTPLRKHVATKCSEFGLDKTETAHIAKFMGHDIRIHENIYKQPVAKTDIIGISKVLEKAQKVQNNSIENEESSNINSGSDTINDSINASALDSSTNSNLLNSSVTENNASDSENEITENSKSHKIRRVPWTKDEVKLVKRHFSEYLETQQLPSLPKIRSIKRDYNILLNRRAEVIKAKINNTIQSKTYKKPTKHINKESTTNNNKINNHIKILFNKYITNNILPTLSKCLTAKNKDKVLESLSALKIQQRVQNFLK